jgi:antitoxin CptB
MSQLARLRWQCRRGTKELDLLLQRYLESNYFLADKEEQALFIELLKQEDDLLIELLLGELKAETPVIQALIEKIRTANPV